MIRTPLVLCACIATLALVAPLNSAEPVTTLRVPLLTEDFEDVSDWSVETGEETCYARENIDGAFIATGGALVTATLGTYTRDWHGPRIYRDLLLPIGPEQDFAMTVEMASGSSDWGELNVVLTDAAGNCVGRISWISTCGTPTGEIHFWSSQDHEWRPFNYYYTGCASAFPEFEGTLVLQRSGTTWTGWVNGDLYGSFDESTNLTASRVYVATGNAFTLPFRDIEVRHLEVEALIAVPPPV